MKVIGCEGEEGLTATRSKKSPKQQHTMQSHRNSSYFVSSMHTHIVLHACIALHYSRIALHTQVSEAEKFSADGRLLEAETYIGGHVECLETGWVDVIGV